MVPNSHIDDSHEDEYHFIMKCPLYTELRKTYIEPFTNHNTFLESFVHVMSSKVRSVITSVAASTYHGFNLHVNFIGIGRM